MARWEFEHSVFTKAKREKVWDYWTRMANHAKMEPSVEEIVLDGPFDSGTKGRTITKDYSQEWVLRDVVDMQQFTIIGETPDGKGFLSFSWSFEDDVKGTRLQQRIIAEGPQVEEHLSAFQRMEKGAIAGMNALVKELDNFHSSGGE